ncbi:MAG TPA: hypothetical protein VGG56_10170 [Terracidiphilus sp.]|jgi:hypothetical protein
MSTGVITAAGQGIPLETNRIVTPLGIRFWDLTLNLPITDGLLVNLRLLNSAWPILKATLTSAGVYAFFGLPGLRAVEYPNSNGFGPARTLTYVVTVQDQLGRYLPAVLVYTMDETGAVLVSGVPDNTRGARLAYLFSAPTRPAPRGMAAVTAYLIDQGTNAPAAWAVVNIQVGADPEIWSGIADDSGRALVLVPFPAAQSFQAGSPPGSGQANVNDDTWPLTVTVQYSPGLLGYPLAGAADLEWPWTDTPNLKDILTLQQTATIWSDPATPGAQFDATLTFGQGLVLRSTAASASTISPSLNISQGSSPP